MNKGKYFLYSIGSLDLSSHIDAVHAASPQSDEFTGTLVNGVIKNIKASGIIATVSRTLMDVNRSRTSDNAPAIDEYRRIIPKSLTQKILLIILAN